MNEIKSEKKSFNIGKFTCCFLEIIYFVFLVVAFVFIIIDDDEKEFNVIEIKSDDMIIFKNSRGKYDYFEKDIDGLYRKHENLIKFQKKEE